MGLRYFLGPLMIIAMTFEYFENGFRKKAIQSGYSEDNICRCLVYAKPLIDKDLPVIFNTANLSALVGYKKNFIKRAVLYTDYFYRNFTILKKNGSKRELKEPLPSLKEIQCWILENILYNVPVSKYAKAYVKKRNLTDNVKYHKGRDVVVTLDINNFFSSIERSSVEGIFLELGYSSNISNLLSKLCCCNEILPQGAPTSPYLSNIYMRGFDMAVSNYCNKQNIRYTRYADDITLSGDNIDPSILIDFVKENLEAIKLSLNEDKVKVMGKNVPQIVTGIIVNDKIQVPKEYRDKIRQEIYFIKKFGLANHLRNVNCDKVNYVYHLLGKINFALQINPKDLHMAEYKSYLHTLIG